MSDAPGAFGHYVAAHHVEGKAAIQIRAAGSTGGTIHHNNPYGTCLYCRLQVPTLLPEGATLTVVPLPTAEARSPWWTSEAITFVGNSRDPSETTAEDETERP